MGSIGAPELIVIGLIVLFPAIGYVIGARRGRALLGLLLGLVLGPFGVIILLFIPGPKCPDCKGDVIVGATKCKNCGSTLPPPT